MHSSLARILPAVLVAAAVGGLVLAVFGLTLAVSEKTDDEGSYRIVRELGFTDATIVGRHPGQVAAWQNGCSEDDTSAVDMRAKDAAGRTHAFIVCCGGLGNNVGCAIRVR